MARVKMHAMVCFASAAVIGAGVVHGQGYPNKAIRIVTAEPGGGNDFVSRILAQGMSGNLGQQVIIENRASRLLGEMGTKSLPDGYTLYVAGGTFMIGPLLQKMAYDPIRDFAPISILLRSPNVIVVHPSSPLKSVKDLIAQAKARPGELNYASGGNGASTHLSAELFKAMAGVNFTRIDYKGSGPSLIAVMSGEVNLMFPPASSSTPHLKSGKLRILAVTSAEPSPLLPDVPTVAASGVPGYVSVGTVAMYAPARTPAPVISRLNREAVAVLARPDVKEKFLNSGVEAVSSSPEQLGAEVKAEIARIGKLIKDTGIRTNE